MVTQQPAIAHYGVKGMHWGVRRDKTPTPATAKIRPGRKVKATGGKYQGPSDDAIRAAVNKRQAKKSSTDSLSNKDLQDLVNRMNLEQQYSRLTAGDQHVGVKVAKGILKATDDNHITAVSAGVAGVTGNPLAGAAVGLGLRGAKAVAGGNNGGQKKKKK